MVDNWSREVVWEEGRRQLPKAYSVICLLADGAGQCDRILEMVVVYAREDRYEIEDPEVDLCGDDAGGVG